jgi:hypothetical protein
MNSQLGQTEASENRKKGKLSTAKACISEPRQARSQIEQRSDKERQISEEHESELEVGSDGEGDEQISKEHDQDIEVDVQGTHINEEEVEDVGQLGMLDEGDDANDKAANDKAVNEAVQEDIGPKVIETPHVPTKKTEPPPKPFKPPAKSETKTTLAAEEKVGSIPLDIPNPARSKHADKSDPHDTKRKTPGDIHILPRLVAQDSLDLESEAEVHVPPKKVLRSEKDDTVKQKSVLRVVDPEIGAPTEPKSIVKKRQSEGEDGGNEAAIKKARFEGPSKDMGKVDEAGHKEIFQVSTAAPTTALTRTLILVNRSWMRSTRYV